MRNEFLQVETLEQAQNEAPWAAEMVEAEGGFWAFESVTDAATWKAQA